MAAPYPGSYFLPQDIAVGYSNTADNAMTLGISRPVVLGILDPVDEGLRQNTGITVLLSLAYVTDHHKLALQHLTSCPTGLQPLLLVTLGRVPPKLISPDL